MAVVLPLDPTLGKPRKLLAQAGDLTRLKHYGLRTERTYCGWIARFIRFHELRHSRELGEGEMTAFLTHLARDGAVAVSTQNETLSALLFLYKKVPNRKSAGWETWSTRRNLCDCRHG